MQGVFLVDRHSCKHRDMISRIIHSLAAERIENLKQGKFHLAHGDISRWYSVMSAGKGQLGQGYDVTDRTSGAPWETYYLGSG